MRVVAAAACVVLLAGLLGAVMPPRLRRGSPLPIPSALSAGPAASGGAQPAPAGPPPAGDRRGERGLREAAARATPGELLAITFGDGRLGALFAAWVWNARRAGVAHVVGALDEAALVALDALGAPAYLAGRPLGGQDGGHATAAWRAFASARVAAVGTLLRLGRHAAMVDVDVMLLRDPAPYLLCTSEDARREHGRLGCATMGGADVAIGSDSLGVAEDASLGAGYLRTGIFNTGFVFVRNNPAGRAFADAWARNVGHPEGPYAGLTTDQQVFNTMLRNESRSSWPGVEPWPPPVPGAPSRSLNGWKGRARFGTLPLALFANGHTAFVQRAQDAPAGYRPYTTHATYVHGVSIPMSGKAVRFQQLGWWPPLREEQTPKLLSVEWPWAVSGHRRGAAASRREAGKMFAEHLRDAAAQVAALAAAVAAAWVLGRALVLPELRCSCDKLWGGSDDVFATGCMYPGAQSALFVPFVCPLDHLLEVSKMYRPDTGELLVAAPGSEDYVRVIPAALLPTARAGADAQLELPGVPRDDEELAALARGLRGAAHLRLGGPGAAAAVTSFRSAAARSRFEAMRAAALRPSDDWCSVCRGAPCPAFVPGEVLSGGRASVRKLPDGNEWLCARLPEPRLAAPAAP